MRPRPSAALRIALACTVLAVACTRGTAPSVQVAEVRRAPLRVVVSTNGKVEPVDDARSLQISIGHNILNRSSYRGLDRARPGMNYQSGWFINYQAIVIFIYDWW